MHAVAHACVFAGAHVGMLVHVCVQVCVNMVVHVCVQAAMLLPDWNPQTSLG